MSARPPITGDLYIGWGVDAETGGRIVWDMFETARGDEGRRSYRGPKAWKGWLRKVPEIVRVERRRIREARP
jgi:hypothetical protein